LHAYCRREWSTNSTNKTKQPLFRKEFKQPAKQLQSLLLTRGEVLVEGLGVNAVGRGESWDVTRQPLEEFLLRL
jgi:hypothetical protein